MRAGDFGKGLSRVLKDMSLGGKIALVTGSSRGIGAAIAMKLAEAGATVIIKYKRSESYIDAAKVYSAIRNRGGCAHTVNADMSKSREVKIW